MNLDRDDIKVNGFSGDTASDYDRLKVNEEYAAETAPVPVNYEKPDVRANQPSNTLGWLTLALAVASMFIWPLVLGPAAAVFGVLAFVRGNRTLGGWSIALGLIAFIAYVAIVPYFS